TSTTAALQYVRRRRGNWPAWSSRPLRHCGMRWSATRRWRCGGGWSGCWRTWTGSSPPRTSCASSGRWKLWSRSARRQRRRCWRRWPAARRQSGSPWKRRLPWSAWPGEPTPGHLSPARSPPKSRPWTPHDSSAAQSLFLDLMPRRHPMRMPKSSVVLVSCLLFCGSAAVAGEGGLKSGPQVGQGLPGPFNPVNVTNVDQPDRAGTRNDYTEQYGADPIVLIFARELSGPLATLAKKLDAAVAKNRMARLRAVVVVLS